ENPIRPECDPKRMQETLLGQNLSTQQVTDGLKSYFGRCGKELSKGKAKGVAGLAKFALVKYQVYDNPDVKPVIIKFGSQNQTYGFLALKPDQVRRPFVVVKCGLMCDGEPSASTRNYI